MLAPSEFSKPVNESLSVDEPNPCFDPPCPSKTGLKQSNKILRFLSWASFPAQFGDASISEDYDL